MRRVVIALLAMTCLAIVAPAPAAAQNSIGFRNECPVPIIMQGWSLIGGIQRRGAPLLIAPGRVAFDVGVPNGIRFYSALNGNQPALVLLRDFPIPPRAGDVLFIVRPAQAGLAEIVLPGTP